jgi:hypothetical protein
MTIQSRNSDRTQLESPDYEFCLRIRVRPHHDPSSMGVAESRTGGADALDGAAVSLDRLLAQTSPLSSFARSSYLRCHTARFSEIARLLHAVEAWRGVVIEPSPSGLRFVADGQTLGHLRWDGRLDVPLPAELARQIANEELATRDPNRLQRSQVVWMVRTHADVDRAVWLLRLAYLLTVEDRMPEVPRSTGIPRDQGGRRGR